MDKITAKKKKFGFTGILSVELFPSLFNARVHNGKYCHQVQNGIISHPRRTP